MEYEESERSGYQEREDIDLTDGVHIRKEDRGIMMYAVFDGEEQVSPEHSPLNEKECISFAEGYSKAKEVYTRLDKAILELGEDRAEMLLDMLMGYEHKDLVAVRNRLLKEYNSIYGEYTPPKCFRDKV